MRPIDTTNDWRMASTVVREWPGRVELSSLALWEPYCTILVRYMQTNYCIDCTSCTFVLLGCS